MEVEEESSVDFYRKLLNSAKSSTGVSESVSRSQSRSTINFNTSMMSPTSFDLFKKKLS
jgi:hypothetical protein